MNINILENVQKKKPVAVEAGKATRLSTDALDASDLAATTGSNPTYVITGLPTFGLLLKEVTTYSKTIRVKRTNQVKSPYCSLYVTIYNILHRKRTKPLPQPKRKK